MTQYWPSDLPKEVQYLRGFKPLHEYLRDYAQINPEKTYMIWYGKEITTKQMNDYTESFATFLYNLGVRKGDRVACFMASCPQYTIVYASVHKLGAIFVPCSPVYKEWDLETQINSAGAETIIAADNLYNVVSNIRDKTQLKHVITTNYGDFNPEEPTLEMPPEIQLEKLKPTDTYDLLDAINNTPANLPPIEVSMDDVASMYFTSGSTGMPKGAMLTHANTVYKTACSAMCNEISIKDTVLVTVAIFSIAGTSRGVNPFLYTNATVVLLHKFEPELVLKAVDKYKVTNWYSIVPMNIQIMDLPKEVSSKYDLSSIRVNSCTSFGVTLTKEIADQWKEYTNGCILCEAAYGLTETFTSDTFMPLEKIKYGSCGLPIMEEQIKIVDYDTGEEKAVGEQGEIIIKSQAVFKGYYNDPEKTAEVVRDGWLHTGDIGFVDEDGYLTWCGRYKEMIKVDGYSVFPEDVEVMIKKHPAVAQVAVIGIPDKKKGEVAKAFVKLKPEFIGKITEDEIIVWAKEKMAPHKRPRVVEFRDEFPVAGNGKMLRKMFKEL